MTSSRQHALPRMHWFLKICETDRTSDEACFRKLLSLIRCINISVIINIFEAISTARRTIIPLSSCDLSLEYENRPAFDLRLSEIKVSLKLVWRSPRRSLKWRLSTLFFYDSLLVAMTWMIDLQFLTSDAASLKCEWCAHEERKGVNRKTNNRPSSLRSKSINAFSLFSHLLNPIACLNQ